MKHAWKRTLSVVLSVVMLLSLALPVGAAGSKQSSGIEWGKVEDPSGYTSPRRSGSKIAESGELTRPTGKVRVSIVLSDDPTLSRFSTRNIAENQSAMQYRGGLRAKQDAVAQAISRQVLNGQPLDIVWHLTLAANIISANVPASAVELIKGVPGVKDVFAETQYEPAAGVSSDSPNQAVATGMTGAQAAWSSGYNGAGSKIAIIDTGLDTDHQSFNAAAFQYAIDEDIANGKEITLLTESDVTSKWSSLNISERLGSASGVYRDAKVPFGANYVDSSYDITHDNDGQGEHGSHVAGIAAANRYIPQNGSFEPALDTVLTQGEAPDAQLLIMKVFGKGGGAYDSDYMVAIEDAIVLGCDVVNLSLGSAVAGSPFNDTYAAILDSFADSDTVVSISSGNNSYWAEHTPYGYLYADDINFATDGSPGTYANAFTVASVDNDGQIGAPLKFQGTSIFFTESSGEYSNAPISTIAGDRSFVYLATQGGNEEADFAAVADVLRGKIAICSRGGTTFSEKANAAVKNGAIGVIIVNNQPGTFGMILSDYEYTAPCVSITQADGAIIKAGATYVDGDVPYYTGTITVTADMEAISNDSELKTMSTFSSWGVPGDLSLKPEIAAPGGNIWSVNGLVPGGTAYEIMSGTSMAAPQIAGIIGLMGQYIREEGLSADGLTTRGLIQSLLMSTAEVMTDAESGYYYPVMQQGAGFVDVEAAISARTYLQMQSVKTAGADTGVKTAAASMADGKIKAELGEDKDRTGSYEVTFTVNNLTDEPIGFALDGEFFTQDMFSVFRDTWMTPIDAQIDWIIDGEEYEPGEGLEYDFNDDGVFDHQDAQALLDKIVQDAEIINEDVAKGLDGDSSSLSTRDAYECLKLANEAAAIVPANGSTTVTARIQITMPDALDVNGNYVEGYLFIKEGETADGAEGVEHSIPVFGFYGNWSDASMFDVGSHLEYVYGLENMPPYMYVNSALGQNALHAATYIIQYLGDGGSYYFGGNPYIEEDFYDEARNAMRSDSTISAVRYTQIRNGAGTRFTAEADGSKIYEKTLGESYAAYYYPSDGTWKITTTQFPAAFTPSGAANNTALDMAVTIAPHYYAQSGSIDWDSLGEGCSYAMSAVVDDQAPEITKLEGEKGGELSFTVEENQYVAYYALLNDSYETLAEFGGDPDAKAGETVELSFDISEYDTDHLLVVVADYATNETLYYVNFNEEELNDPESQAISVDPEELILVVGNSAKVTATVEPWGVDQTVTWASDDTSVATVDENGVITAVAEGETIITATAAINPDLVAEVYVLCMKINKDLNGIVWDENGAVWFSAFNLSTLPGYEKLSGSMRMPIASATYDQNGTMYVATFDSDAMTSTLYTLDESTYELTEVGSPAKNGYVDIAPAPSLGDNILMGVYGTYAVIIDKDTGDIIGVFDLAEDTGGNNLVGIAYEMQYYSSSYGNTDRYFLLDQAGNFYRTGFLPYNGSYSRFVVSNYGTIGDPVDSPYFQSLYYDGESIYWSRFDSGENDVDIVMVYDLYGEGLIFSAGTFDPGVWPVGGLYEKGVNPALGFTANPASHDDALIDASAVFETEVAPIAVKSGASKGTLSAAVSGNTADPNASRRDETVTVEADQATVPIRINAYDLSTTSEDVAHNGLYVVSYDTEKLTYVNTETDLPYTSVKNDAEAGTVTFAFADLDGAQADATVATVVFEKAEGAEDEELTASVTCDELNDIEPDEVVVTAIAADPGPDKTEYIDGEEFDPTGMVITATFSDGSTKEIPLDECTIEPEGELTLDVTEITVSWTDEYGNTVSTTIPVTVEPVLESIAADPGPDKTEYESGEEFDPTGMTIVATYSDGTTVEVPLEDCTIEPTGPLGPGTTEITVTYTDENGTTVSMTIPIKVKGSITVEPVNPSTPATPGHPAPSAEDTLPFRDVTKSDYFYDDVKYLYNAGFMSGTSATTFSPNMPITRGMIVTVIWRMTGQPAPAAANPFKDVKPGSYYEKAIAWAAEKGVVTGYNAATFGPDDTITREQLAAILFRYGKLRGVQPFSADLSVYADAAQISAYAREAMSWAVGCGILNGVGGNRLNPQGTANRGQASAMIHRFIQNAGYQTTNETGKKR